MIIKNITIENFQSYYKSQTMDFSRGLNLVIGNGGKGKSKLFNAFYWVLFGKIYITGIGWCTTDNLPQSAKFAMQRYEFINKRALYKANINEEITASVQIELEDDKGINYIIERSVCALRLDEDNWDSDKAWQIRPNVLKVSFDSVTGTRVLNDLLAEDKITELFPDGIRNYIWFQGESLESLINFRNKETLKAAVKHISYFPYYEKLSEIISKSKIKIAGIESRKLKELNKHNANVKGLLSNIETLNYKIGKEEENKRQLESNIDTVKIALADGETKISGLASYSMLVKKYKDCENEISRLLTETTRIDNFQREKLPALWILRGIEPMIVKCKEIFFLRINENKFSFSCTNFQRFSKNPIRNAAEQAGCAEFPSARPACSPFYYYVNISSSYICAAVRLRIRRTVLASATACQRRKNQHRHTPSPSVMVLIIAADCDDSLSALCSFRVNSVENGAPPANLLLYLGFLLYYRHRIFSSCIAEIRVLD